MAWQAPERYDEIYCSQGESNFLKEEKFAKASAFKILERLFYLCSISI
jgi:hypothetical protein